MKIDEFGDEHGYKESDFLFYVLKNMGIVSGIGFLLMDFLGMLAMGIWVFIGMSVLIFTNFFIPTKERLRKRDEKVKQDMKSKNMCLGFGE
ncbi:hypothetical protein A3715_15805 [Oleiphilus sp. HI0009]|nr:hypothetical protein A3715_15805 [Oleiphilus sp. HI0009]